MYGSLVSPPPQSFRGHPGKAEGVPSLANEAGRDNVLYEGHVSCIWRLVAEKRTKTIGAERHRLFFL
jgi:hypothetical protein